MVGGGIFYVFGNSSRELADIEKGIQLVKENGIELIIGDGGHALLIGKSLVSAAVFGGGRRTWRLRKNDRFGKRIRKVKKQVLKYLGYSWDKYKGE